MTVTFPEATRGHQISVYGPPEHKIWSIACSCGALNVRRQRVPGKVGTRIEPLDAFRARGDIHLHEIWKAAQQGTLA